MKTIVFVSEKGGVGKTRLSDELYYYYKRLGLPVSLYSFDGQYQNRTEGKKSENPSVAVVDTPGSVMDERTSQTVSKADLVVIPVRPTAGNIESFTRTVALVKERAECPILVAVNCNNRYKTAQEFKSWLEDFSQRENLAPAVFVPQAEAMAKAETSRGSVLDIDRRSRAAAAVTEMGERVSQLAGVQEEQ